MAILEINKWTSTCLDCKLDADNRESHHINTFSDAPGCGAKFEFWTSGYTFPKDMWRDLEYVEYGKVDR